MAASNSDKITDVRNSARPVSTTVGVNRAVGGTTLTCASLTGWPTASKVHFVTYQIDTNSNPVSGTQLDCYGIVSGSNITSMTIVDGSDAGNSVGDVVEMLPTAAWGQDLADGLTTSHNRDGTIKAASITEAMQVLADNTTNNVSNSSHGYAPKNPNDATKYLDGTGAYTSPGVATSPWSLLKANSGTDTTSSATTVDSVALSGLSAKDTLLIYYNADSNGNTTAGGFIYHVTDSSGLISTSALTSDQAENATFTLRQMQNSNVRYVSTGIGIGAVSLGSGGSTTASVTAHGQSNSTAWTGSWTIGLRHGGVTAGGTYRWSWSVYRIAGQ